MSIYLRSVFIILASVSFAVTSFADNLTTIKVSFKTLACDGTVGLASLDVDKIVKIEPFKCEVGDPVKQVHQILVSSKDSGFKYRVFTTTKEGAEKIMKTLDAYQGEKRKAIQDSNGIVIY